MPLIRENWHTAVRPGGKSAPPLTTWWRLLSRGTLNCNFIVFSWAGKLTQVQSDCFGMSYGGVVGGTPRVITNNQSVRVNFTLNIFGISDPEIQWRLDTNTNYPSHSKYWEGGPSLRTRECENIMVRKISFIN